jgi:hypothetical protein
MREACIRLPVNLTEMVVVVMHVAAEHASSCLSVQLNPTAMAIVVIRI